MGILADPPHVELLHRYLEDIVDAELKLLENRRSYKGNSWEVLMTWKSGMQREFVPKVIEWEERKDVVRWRRLQYSLLWLLSSITHGTSMLGLHSGVYKVKDDHTKHAFKEEVELAELYHPAVNQDFDIPVEILVLRERSLGTVVDSIAKFLQDKAWMTLETINVWEDDMKELPFQQWDFHEWEILMQLVRELHVLLLANPDVVISLSQDFYAQWKPKGLVKQVKE